MGESLRVAEGRRVYQGLEMVKGVGFEDHGSASGKKNEINRPQPGLFFNH
jgi:hypothetical protein